MFIINLIGFSFSDAKTIEGTHQGKTELVFIEQRFGL